MFGQLVENTHINLKVSSRVKTLIAWRARKIELPGGEKKKKISFYLFPSVMKEREREVRVRGHESEQRRRYRARVEFYTLAPVYFVKLFLWEKGGGSCVFKSRGTQCDGEPAGLLPFFREKLKPRKSRHLGLALHIMRPTDDGGEREREELLLRFFESWNVNELGRDYALYAPGAEDEESCSLTFACFSSWSQNIALFFR